MLSMEMKTEGLDLYVDDFDEWKAINGNFEAFFDFLFILILMLMFLSSFMLSPGPESLEER